MDLKLVQNGILTPETMLRTAQAEIDDIAGKLERALAVIVRLEAQVKASTAHFCALVVQYGGTATITAAEVAAAYTMKRAFDPKTRVSTFTIERKEPDPKPEIVT